MKTPHRVLWSEGMFMSPQHMQQLDAYHEQVVESRIAAVAPHTWGVVSLEVSRSSLASGQLQVDQFAGVLPDGLVVAFESGDAAAPASRLIEGHFPATDTTLDVLLGVPRERERASNYAKEGNGAARARFIPTEFTVVDAGNIDSEVPVLYARPRVEILFEDEPLDDFETMKIAEITRTSNGALVVCDPYIPPCLRLSASPFLVEGLRRVLTTVAAQRRDLAVKRRQTVPGRLEFAAADVGLYLQLNALSGAIPVLQHMVDAADMTPRAAYLYLVELAGQLCAFSPDAEPAELPRFHYTDLRSTFEVLLARLMSLLHAAVPDRFVSVPIELRPEGYYLARFENDDLMRTGTLFLTVQSQRPEQEIADVVPRLSKLASPREIEVLMRAATPGIPLNVTHRPPSEIPVRRSVSYFALSTHNEQWTQVENERALAIYLPPQLLAEQTTLELLIVPKA